jgi:ABC-type transport system involved in multi-copper enzyme maturation permease subunit
MDSLVHSTRSLRPLRAWAALLKADLIAIGKSWVLRGWIIALTLVEFFWLTTTLQLGRMTLSTASSILAGYLGGYLLIWSTVIIVLSAGSVSLETDIISDSILSRACTRTQYIASKLASRIIVILGIYLLFSIIAGYAAWRYAANDMTWVTMATGISIVGLSVLMLVALGIAFSVLFNNTVVSIVGLLVLWYVAAPIFNFMGAEYLSPASFARNLPLMLKNPDALKIVSASASNTSLTIFFSRALNSNTAGNIDNYVVESPEGNRITAQTATYDPSNDSVVLAGLSLKSGYPVKVSGQNITDIGGGLLSPAADSLNLTVPGVNKGSAAIPVPAKKILSAPKTKSAGTPLRVIDCDATANSLRVRFSKEVDSISAQKPENYVIESPYGKTQSARVATYDSATHSVLLSGLSFASGDPVKVTVKGVSDKDGFPISRRGNSAIYTEVTTWKYVLGFGIPAILAGLVAIFAFSRRDL